MHARTMRITIVAVAIGVAVLVITNQKREVPQAAESRAETRSPYSEEELKAFWNEHLRDCEAFILHGTFRIPEIAERYCMLRDLIAVRYGRTFHVNLSPAYIEKSRSIAAGNHIKGGIPTIDLVIPKVFETSKEFLAAGDPQWKERLENSVIVSTIHELDHLAYGWTSEHELPMDQLVDNERRAWAETCEHTLRVMIEQYRSPMHQSDEKYYDLWVSCGRDVESPRWILEIRLLYSGALDKPVPR